MAGDGSDGIRAAMREVDLLREAARHVVRREVGRLLEPIEARLEALEGERESEEDPETIEGMWEEVVLSVHRALATHFGEEYMESVPAMNFDDLIRNRLVPKEADDGSGVVSPEGPPVEESLAESAKGGPAGHPEPGEPKVVGYVGIKAPLEPGSEALIYGRPTPRKRPVVFLRDHEAEVRDIGGRLGGLPDSKLTGEDGLAAATMREIAHLKAENERLEKEVEAVQRLRRIDRDGFGTQMAALGRRARELEATITRLKAERDAYADPGNWTATIRKSTDTDEHADLDSPFHGVRYIGPTPSDSTERESVEGDLELAWAVIERLRHHCDPADTGLLRMIEELRARIPTPGGQNDA